MLSLSGYGGSPEPEEKHTNLPVAVASSNVSIEIHLVRYYQQCLLLRSCGALLRFPPRPITTALAYLHKYYEADSSGEEVPLMDSCVSGSDTTACSTWQRCCPFGQPAHFSQPKPFLSEPQSLVSACLLLASKVEEVSLMTGAPASFRHQTPFTCRREPTLVQKANNG